MLSNIPILNIDTSKLDPPYDKKGSVTPVTGISPTTTIKFRIVWKANEKIIPKDRYLAKLSSCLIEILIPLYIMVIKNININNIPIKPNSSLIMEKIKSVCGSGK